MICKSCALGAEYNVAARNYDPVWSERLRLLAKNQHNHCKGCDCQHKSNVLVGIDWSKVNARELTQGNADS